MTGRVDFKEHWGDRPHDPTTVTVLIALRSLLERYLPGVEQVAITGQNLDMVGYSFSAKLDSERVLRIRLVEEDSFDAG